jgi:hypothetical protein
MGEGTRAERGTQRPGGIENRSAVVAQAPRIPPLLGWRRRSRFHAVRLLPFVFFFSPLTFFFVFQRENDDRQSSSRSSTDREPFRQRQAHSLSTPFDNRKDPVHARNPVSTLTSKFAPSASSKSNSGAPVGHVTSQANSSGATMCFLSARILILCCGAVSTALSFLLEQQSMILSELQQSQQELRSFQQKFEVLRQAFFELRADLRRTKNAKAPSTAEARAAAELVFSERLKQRCDVSQPSRSASSTDETVIRRPARSAPSRLDSSSSVMSVDLTSPNADDARSNNASRAVRQEEEAVFSLRSNMDASRKRRQLDSSSSGHNSEARSQQGEDIEQEGEEAEAAEESDDRAVQFDADASLVDKAQHHVDRMAAASAAAAQSGAPRDGMTDSAPAAKRRRA